MQQKAWRIPSSSEYWQHTGT